MNQIGIIYCAHCLSTGKKYIGQTKRNLKERIRQHKKDRNRLNYLFYRAINKYGFESFVWGIIEECNLNQLNDREIYWISKLQSNNPSYGYNMTSGGEFGIPKEDLIKTGKRNGTYVYENKIGIFSYDKETKSNIGKIGGTIAYQNKLGIHSHTREEKSHYGKKGGLIRAEQLSKTFELLSPDGILYKGKNITQFCKKHNLQVSGISQLLNGKVSNYKGWNNPNNTWIPVKDADNKKLKKFNIIDPNGKNIEVVNLAKFCKENNLAKTSIYRLFSGKLTSYRGWTLPENFLQTS